MKVAAVKAEARAKTYTNPDFTDSKKDARKPASLEPKLGVVLVCSECCAGCW